MKTSRNALIFTGLLVSVLFATAHSLPPRRSREASKDSFVAVGTNEIATSVLQSYVDVDGNIAFSPLGVSVLLAILAEGAKGETRDQLVAALHLPADREETRAAYKTVLSRLKEKHTLNHPEFRNWFYIYKNYTAEQCFRDVLEENYLTEVRDVERPISSQDKKDEAPSSTDNDIVVHKPIRMEQAEGVRVELPVIPADEGEQAQEQVQATKTSQEDSIRTIMMQEAVAMQEALKEENKTASYIKDREEVIKVALEKDDEEKKPIMAAVEQQMVMEKEKEIMEAMEKDVVEKEQIKVAVEEQIQLEKEIEAAIADKVEKQEAIKGALEEDMAKEEEAIDALKMAQSMPETIQVAVVVMNADEVKQDGGFKEEHVNFDHENENDAPLPPFKDASIFDPNIEAKPTEEKKEHSLEETKLASAAEGEKELPFTNVSIFDHPNSPVDKPDEQPPKKDKNEKKPLKVEEVVVAPVKEEPDEGMMAIERKVRSTDEVTSSLSGNNLVSKASSTEQATSMMIAFNALYFKGSWKTPFVEQSAEGPHSFYTSEDTKIAVPVMHAEGNFNIGKIAALDSVAIDLPYEGGRYSLLVLLPNSRGGLKKLIADLTGYSLCDLSKTLTSQYVEVCLPSFEVQTTSKPIRALEKFGVSHVFNQENADLSGITPVNGLFVQDMSQLVTLNVELSSTSTNFLTASSEAASTRGDGDKFIADRPFLYFVHDIVDNIIVVAGKVTDPTIAADDSKTEI